MSSNRTAAVELDHTTDRSTLALVLALLSVPGSIITWDLLPGGGFVWGAPLAVLAIILAVPSLRIARGKATAAIVIAGVMIAMMAIWTIAELV
jgi:hypothetical protein